MANIEKLLVLYKNLYEISIREIVKLEKELKHYKGKN